MIVLTFIITQPFSLCNDSLSREGPRSSGGKKAPDLGCFQRMQALDASFWFFREN